jgi:hypothetical protein
MSAATVSALALVCLLSFFIIESLPKTVVSFMDLQEIKDLPVEIKTAIKNILPNSSQLKKHWATMNSQQKQMVIQQITSQLPGPPKAPSSFIKNAPSESGLKPGFLLPKRVNKGEKKAPKDEKEDEVITLGDIGSSDAEVELSGE